MHKTLLLLGALLSVSCSSEAPRPVLRIATDATFAPFHLIDESGRPTGFDVELARAVAMSAGFEPIVLVLPYDELFSGLAKNTHDMVAATTGITPERERIYLFSKPYFETCQVAVVRVGPTEPANLADLQGARIGAAGSGTSMKAMQSIDGDHIQLNDEPGAQSVVARIIDAWIVDEFDGIAAARESQGDLRVLPESVATESYAFVMASGRTDLKARLDRGLEKLEKSGYVAQLQKTFGIERKSGCPAVSDDE